jgi:hypothetical protein
VFIAEHLTEYEAMAARIADNKVSSGDYDKELLKFDIGTLELNHIDLKLTAIDDLELNQMTVGNESEVQSEIIGDVPDMIKKMHECPECGFNFSD